MESNKLKSSIFPKIELDKSENITIVLSQEELFNISCAFNPSISKFENKALFSKFTAALQDSIRQKLDT